MPDAHVVDGGSEIEAVVVVNYGSSALLEQNLVPLSTAIGSLAVVVVDNPTTPEERDLVRAIGERQGWTVLTPDTNLGFGGGMNLGVAAAHGRGAVRTMLLNPDASIPASAFALLSTRVRERPMTMVSPQILRPDGSTWFAGSDLYPADGRIRSTRRRIDGADVVPWLSGACLLVSRQLWERMGGFDPRYFLYWEDVDLSRRAVAAGGALEVLREAVALHDEGGTHRDAGVAAGHSEPKSAIYYYYNVRNRLLYASIWLQPAGVRAWRRSTPAVSWEILLQGGRRQLLHPIRPVRAVLRGMRDGFTITRNARRTVGG